MLYSISYLKNEFDDYYNKNRKSDNYLYTILTILLKRESYDLDAVIAINETLKLFPNRYEEKILTFAKKIE